MGIIDVNVVAEVIESLSNALHQARREKVWMSAMGDFDTRYGDKTLISNANRAVAYFDDRFADQYKPEPESSQIGRYNHDK